MDRDRCEQDQFGRRRGESSECQDAGSPAIATESNHGDDDGPGDATRRTNPAVGTNVDRIPVPPIFMNPSSIPVSRDGRSTLNRTEWPLVVVPGLLASRLEETPGGNKIWDPDHLAFTVGLMMDSPESLARRFTPEETPGQ